MHHEALQPPPETKIFQLHASLLHSSTIIKAEVLKISSDIRERNVVAEYRHLNPVIFGGTGPATCNKLTVRGLTSSVAHWVGNAMVWVKCLVSIMELEMSSSKSQHTASASALQRYFSLARHNSWSCDKTILTWFTFSLSWSKCLWEFSIPF